MRGVPQTAACAGARNASANARYAGRRSAPSLAAGAISGKGPQVDAIDLGLRIWVGSNGRLRALYELYTALAAAIGASGLRGVEPAGLADFSGRNVERMAVHDHTPRSAGNANPGGTV